MRAGSDIGEKFLNSSYTLAMYHNMYNNIIIMVIFL